MPDLFKEVIPSILQTKKDAFKGEGYEDYKPFLINRSLSYHMDCVLYVNEMNINPGVDKDMQYHYLLNTIRPMKRKFQPWQKSETLKDLECVKIYFGYSNDKAKEALRILDEEQLNVIRNLTDTGGIKK